MDNPWEYEAWVKRVIDGDTVSMRVFINVDVDFGFKIGVHLRPHHDLHLRLYGVDTPEISGRKAKLEKEAGHAARNFVLEWLDEHCPKDDNGWWKVHLKSWDAKRLDSHPGKYHGRWLAELWDPDIQESLTVALREAGHDKLSQS